MQRTFVLGLGAQKAGTTWLHGLLSRAEGFAPGLAKEYHVFDHREVPCLKPLRRRLSRVRTRGDLELLLMERFPGRYFAHVDRLLSGPGRLAADITPSYAALGPETLREIRRGIEARGIRFRCVFIMRDPITRCVSAFTMNRRRGAGAPLEGVCPAGDPEAAFRDYLRSEHARIRTDYSSTIAAMEAAFTPDDYKILLYETMFTQEVIEKFEFFLGLSLDRSFGDRRVFAQAHDFEPSAASERLCREVFAPTYDHVAAHFPEARSLWSGLRKYPEA